MTIANGLTDQQKHYLQGLAMGADVARAVKGLPILSGARSASADAIVQLGPRPLEAQAQDLAVASGKVLANEEKAKRGKDPLAMWDEIQANAVAGKFPRGSDVFLYKFSGLFHVAPAQDSFMCRLRIPGGVLPSWQFRGVADLARRFGAGHADVTTRANLQIREIAPQHAAAMLTGLADLGILNRGAGADNVRNVTASPTSGIDPHELIETLPLAKAMHHDLINHREMYELPRKFNIAFEGGGRIASLDDTNDIGFRAVRVMPDQATRDVPAGVYFLLTLGGITGHGDFARPTGVLLEPGECVEVAGAILRVYIRNGDRTDRKRARLKYLLDDWGFDRFLAEVDKERGRPLRRVDLDRCDSPLVEDRWAHVGVHPQKQPGLFYVGVVLPVGRLSCEQIDGLAAIAERFGRGTIRLTAWQNLLLSDIAEADIETVTTEIEALGLEWDASAVRAGLVACTGSAGCKYAGADTKRNAMELAAYLEERITLDRPVNIHLTGCHHSCAQHLISDIGLEATKVEIDEEMVDGYHLCVGGGWGEEQGIGHRLVDALPFAAVLPAVERLLRDYLEGREGAYESFSAYARRRGLDALRDVVSSQEMAA